MSFHSWLLEQEEPKPWKSRHDNIQVLVFGMAQNYIPRKPGTSWRDSPLVEDTNLVGVLGKLNPLQRMMSDRWGYEHHQWVTNHLHPGAGPFTTNQIEKAFTAFIQTYQEAIA